MKNLMSMMGKARELQEKMGELQAELEAMTVEGVSGGGLVKVTLNGKSAMMRLVLDPSLMKPDEVEVVEDLIVAAYSDAKAKIEQAMAAKMADLTGGLPLPPGFKLF